MFEILRTTRELEVFEPTWRSLWNEDPNSTPFQHPDWLLPWWHQFGQSEARSVVVRRSGKAVAFLPFYLYLEPHSGERQLLPIGIGTSDYLDGIFAPDCEPADVATALSKLRGGAGWEAMIASQLRPQSMLCRALEREPDARPFLSESCWRVRTARITDFPSAIRHKIVNYRNRAVRLGALELRVAGASAWRDCFDELVRLHIAHWPRGVLTDARVLASHREAIPRLHARGLLRLYSLCMNGETLALAYALVDPAGRPGRTLYYYLPAYALARADLHPGTLLLALAIENAAEDGAEWIDLLRGDEAYKKMWHAEARATYGFDLRCARHQSDLAAGREMRPPVKSF